MQATVSRRGDGAWLGAFKRGGEVCGLQGMMGMCSLWVLEVGCL